MSIDTFVRNPLAYTKGHIVQFSHQAAATSAAAAGMNCTHTMNHWSGDWTAEEYQMIPGQYTAFEFQEGYNAQTGARSRIGKSSRDMHSIMCKTVNNDLGIRFLPWKANCVTYMALDANATRFFTGPLSGCCIYMGQNAGGTYYVFHSNRNNAGGVNNSAIKASMTADVITRMVAPVKITKFAVYGQHYSDFGFVFGVRSGTRWRFYAANTALAGGGKFKTTVKEL